MTRLKAALLCGVLFSAISAPLLTCARADEIERRG